MFGTIWSLVPPFIAIALALITKEVYSSLAIGIIFGSLLYSGFNFETTLIHIFNDGIVSVLSDPYNVGILVFLVILGILVAMMNKAGGSVAFGNWVSKKIKSKVGAQCATIFLGILIFIDDYFNCLTVGSVMRPVTDKNKVSRAKLAYLIDATAAPICIIAPVSSWAAAVSSYVEEGNGYSLFLKAIPFNFYALLTIFMMFYITLRKFEFGPMAKYENFDIALPNNEAQQEVKNGKVIDLVFPIVILIISCVIGMIYSGGFFDGVSFVDSFANSDASVGLMLGSAVTLVITVIYYVLRRTVKFSNLMASFGEGFKAMTGAILILTLAWTLKEMTVSLGSKEFVASVVSSSARGLQIILPALLFVIGCVIAFATGTSWGTFGILIPITLEVFPITEPIGVVCVSAALAGAVCGDHCSPISDTTIMASAGAQCDHVTHVNTQLPYAITVAAVSFVTYLIAGICPNAWVTLPIGIILMIVTLEILARKTAN